MLYCCHTNINDVKMLHVGDAPQIEVAGEINIINQHHLDLVDGASGLWRSIYRTRYRLGRIASRITQHPSTMVFSMLHELHAPV